jgi:hypothetical protein
MHKVDPDQPNYADRNPEDLYSKPVRAGKRTYFFDVKTTKGNNDYYLTITESKRRQEQDGRYTYEKHKIFLYKEDFDKFQDGLAEVVDYMRKNLLKEVPVPDGKPNTVEPSSAAETRKDNPFTDVKFEEL